MKDQNQPNDIQQTDSAVPETNTPKPKEPEMKPQHTLDDARDHLDECLRRCDADDLPAALVEVDTALGIIPDTEEGRELLYEAHLARTNVLRQLKLDEVSGDDEKKWTEHEFEEVLLECGRAKALKPGDPEVVALEAQIRVPLIDGTNPQNYFENIVAALSVFPGCSPPRAFLLPVLGRAAEAYDDALMMVEAMPELAMSWRILGQAAEARGYTEEATRAFERYLELCGRVPELKEAWDQVDEDAGPEHHPPAYVLLSEPTCSVLAFPHTDEGLQCAEETAETLSSSPILLSLLEGPGATCHFVEVLSWQDHDVEFISRYDNPAF